MCEMIFTSDEEFFKELSIDETNKYFEESYNFVCNYKNLGEENILSAVVHLDEGTPHMHLIYVPVIHTKDKDGNEINKVCARDFWKGRDSYRKLQNAYFEHITSKGFILDRGLPSYETGRKHETIQDYKRLTNFENTKKVLHNITLELPETPDIDDIKLIKLNKEKVINEIIKPKDNLIQELHKENVSLHKELSKQVNLVKEASKYVKERNSILQENEKMNSKIEDLETEHEIELENMKYSYKKKIDYLEDKITFLEKVVDRFKTTVAEFIHWICNKFSVSSEDALVRDFERETYNNLNVEEQLAHERNMAEEKDLEL